MEKQISILHLEDNPRDSELISGYLEAGGIKCVVDLVRSGPEFTNLVGLKEYDVILSDFKMPGFSGIDALAIARKEAPDVPFIFVSGTIGEELAIESLTQGASDYILKHRPARLASAVIRAIEAAERKKEQAASLAFQQFQAELLANVSESLFAIDAENKFAFWNDGASMLFELEIGHPTGLSLEEVDRICGCEFFRRLLGTAIVPGGSLDLFCECKSGNEKWISAKFSHIFESESQGRLKVFIATDISERKQFETRIVRMNRILEQRIAERTADLISTNDELRSFAYSVSHDLQAPLRVTSAYSHILLHDHTTELSEAARGYIERISAACARMDQLTIGLLHLATLSREQLDRQVVDLSELSRIVAVETAAAFPERRINFVIRDGMMVHADPRLIRSLLDNLIGNAVKYSISRETAVIEIGQGEYEGIIMFFVRDNGIGFSAGQAKTIFQPFNRLHEGPEYYGHGIGLATANRIVTKHGGTMSAVGEINSGATFYFSIP